MNKMIYDNNDKQSASNKDLEQVCMTCGNISHWAGNVN